MKKTKITYCQLGVLSTLFALSACDRQNDPSFTDVDPTLASLTGASDSTTATKASVESGEIKALLQEKLVSWNAETLLKEPAEKEGFASEDALGTLHEISGKDSAPFAYAETRKNGRIVYKNTEGETVKYDLNKGSWKYIGREKLKKTETKSLTDEEAKSEVEEIFSELNLSGKGEVYATGVGVSDGIDDVEPVGRLVRIHRQINDAKVLGSRISAYYGIDGELVRFEVSWPDFDIIEGCEILSRDAFIERLSTEALSSFNTIADSGNV